MGRASPICIVGRTFRAGGSGKGEKAVIFATLVAVGIAVVAYWLAFDPDEPTDLAGRDGGE